MARYTGPKTKISRKFGEPILGNGKWLTKTSNPPGQHGATKKRKTLGEYAIQLKEKQSPQPVPVAQPTLDLQIVDPVRSGDHPIRRTRSLAENKTGAPIRILPMQSTRLQREARARKE